ncbi:DUF1365 domain-containing protein [Shimia sp. R10_1]|uniref:DUF1365 domain-containing protein n=1 Tax=Shimia sp. R10_1 TaxID=2821095 RepID=UPI001AD9ACFA|nr:DUF1365 domain-containing protein [Shimia sp. R10_1]MBO9474257.1 DUF1365 domain-containing protein [Shimia sp. R10_1]
MTIEHIQGHTTHARRGQLKNAFRYGVDFVLTDLSEQDTRLAVLSRNRFNLWSVWDHNHGGVRGAGSGVSWFKDVLLERGFPVENARLLLLTQPSFLWFHFNPVSFWIALIDDQPCAFVAEVNSTFGHRHCYFCAHEDFRPIAAADQLHAQKLMHVSPFQKVAGGYRFNFGFDKDEVRIRIAYEDGDQGVIATLFGPRKGASNGSLIWAAMRRPFGAARVVALIHWQAAILWAKRAPFLKKQPAPDTLLSDNTPASAQNQ